MAPLTEDLKQRLRSRLLRERRRLRASLGVLRRWGFSDAETGGVGELSLYDQHPADLGSELAARQTDLGMASNTRRLLGQVEEALNRFESGTYGVCRRCGRPIPLDRLFAVPWASECAGCQAQDEPQGTDRVPVTGHGPHPGVHMNRPAEEAVLSPPFGRSFRGGAGYDGEDAWNDVARHGTSNTLQDEAGDEAPER
ncbi:MAG: TraR/DksA C4-type zinc finger protein [Firmicutes bacterium]|nr:TraR/DksA C4-type zinc finger protein [Bacillota bacterium]